MRVLRRRQEERGAVAVLVALLAVVLFGLSAFVVDLGVAYTSTRQLQTAADSSALAAAEVYSKKFGTCDQLTNDGALRASAQAIADDYRERNRPGSTGGSLVVNCDFNHRLEVTYKVTGDTDTYFAPLLGGGSKITTARQASAVVEPELVRTRPMAICSSYLPQNPTAGTAFAAYGPGTGQAALPKCRYQPGNFWTLDCPEEKLEDWSRPQGQPSPKLNDQVLSGCQVPIQVVPGQGSKTDQALSDHLKSACNTGAAFVAPVRCLEGDPGMPLAGQVEESWRALIDQSITFALPVFCGPRPEGPPNCHATETGDTVSGNGTNATYPIHQIAVVNLCGFHFGKNPSHRYIKTGPLGWCSEATAKMSALMNDSGEDWYMLFVFRHLQTDGAPVQGCPTGKTCTGIPRVWLSK